MNFYRSLKWLLMTAPIVSSPVVFGDVPPAPLPPGYSVCPTTSDIKKDPSTMIWSTPTGWRSFSASFANRLTQFLGAQWQGVNVGNLSCLYQGDDMTFPIVLQFNRLVYAPGGSKWGKNLGGYRNCVSPHRRDCLFKPKLEEKTGDIYQTASKLKVSGQQELGF